MQMQRVTLRAGVQDAPPDTLPDVVRESLGCGPRQAVDHEGEPRLEIDEPAALLVEEHLREPEPEIARMRNERLERRQVGPLCGNRHPQLVLARLDRPM